LDTYPNITSELFVQGLPVGPPASADLLVEAPPAFQKAFSPSTVDVGQSSTLTFSIDNTLNNADTSSLAFTDNLPAGMLIAAVPNVSTSCVGGIITAAPGAGVITYSGGSVAAGVGCSVQVDVAASAVGSLVNTTGDLTSDKGNSGVANATLTVLEAPLFGKAFAPATVALGAVSTLSFSIDNSANVVDATGLDFTDNLPAGMVVATPANASTTCTGGTLTAASGATVVSYSGGTAPAGASCSLQVDVEAQAAGTLNNITGDLTSSAGNSGPASASLTVSGADIAISKAFQSDPVLRGGQVVLRYTINNLSPSASVDSVAFSDDLGAVIPGWAAVGLPLADACGAGSSVSGTTVVSLSAGSIPAAGNCSFDVTLQLPGTAALGTVTSTTAAVTANAFGNPITGNTASDDLTVVWLGFTKAFVYSGSPVPGSDIGLMFSISNPDPLNAVSGITFSDDLGAAVPGMFANGLPMSGICGAGSQIAGSSVVTLSNGSIAAGGSCSFQISVHIPNSISAGTYTNNTSPLTATPAGGLASSGDPADIASASIALPSGVPAPIVAPNVIPTLDPRMLILLVAMLGLLAVTRVGRMN
ncbi:MAG: IPTL-CTERM sorting domain-containing protein, partial [Xanthomonadales bacterium]|nr:IPTL-CTERM sorting domain-containing protein [Xanthomonadales bacterium]